MQASTKPHASHIQHFDCIIVGGGFIGITQAIALDKLGLKVALLEKNALTQKQSKNSDGRASAIALSSKRLLNHLDIWPYAEPHAEPILDIRVADQHSPIFLHYDHREIGDEPMGWIIENPKLKDAMMQRLNTCKHITSYAPANWQQLKHIGGNVQLTLDDKNCLQAPLLLAADGKFSAIREYLNIPSNTYTYKQVALISQIVHSQPHGGLAVEWFRPDGPFAILPMQDEGGKHRSSIVWTVAQKDAGMFLALDDADFNEEVQLRAGEFLGNVTTTGKRFHYPLMLKHAKTYVDKRIALLGDAAHAIHPIAGQGVNVGFRDIAVLTELIEKQQQLGLDIGSESVLAHYQRWRRFDNTMMIMATDSINRLFSNNILPVKLARRLGLWGVEHLQPAKSFFMRHAMGLTGDVPSLMKE